MTTKKHPNSNGRWQLAFWVVTVFFVMVMGFGANHIILNDRLRASEDQRIMSEVSNLRREATAQTTAILVEIASLKALLENKK